ncbi:MAG: branched-chain amino acid aminotransferase [Micrococcales bacterium]|nr:branched-chain amino acid aminotransferase [Micrococcales bacterium]
MSTASAGLFRVRRNEHPVPDDERAGLLEHPAFGTVFTDHMARVSWTAAGGWTDRRVEPYAPLTLDPATAVLHYAQEIFEGLKAYRHADGSVWTFRPEANAARFARSAHRLALPELAQEDFLGAIEALTAVDVDWVPSGQEASLYLRPFMFASEAFVGVRAAQAVEFLVIASPVGPYFASGGVQPVAIWVDTEYHRAGPGGTGAAKCGGNYAASLLPQQDAYAKGFEQVCFLDVAGRVLEELGGMNIMVVHASGRVTTPAVSGTILEGVTRASILTLLAERGHEVAEEPVSLADLRAGLASGEVAEVFACGTAAVMTPIGRLASDDFDLTVGDGGAGPVTVAIREQLTDIQYGRAADPHGWMYRLV